MLLPITWYTIAIQSWGLYTVIGGIINTPITSEQFIDIINYQIKNW
jgi:hypothetical protein